MSLIPASSVSLKTMADGTLRISFDVEPRNAQDCFQLFASPGTQAVIAALKDGSFLEQPVEPVAEPKPREQLGDACYRTVLWCTQPSFWYFLNYEFSLTSDEKITKPIEAAKFIRDYCNVESRKELDTNPEANKTWHREIRQPYADYLKRIELA